MDEELRKILENARAKGANKQQLRQIADLYMSKKKESPDFLKSPVPDLPDELGGPVEQKPKSKPSSQTSLTSTQQPDVAVAEPEPEPIQKQKAADTKEEKSIFSKAVDDVKDILRLRYEQGKDIATSIVSGTAGAVAGIAGVPNFINKTAFIGALEMNKALGVKGMDEFEARFNRMPPEQQERFINGLTDKNPIPFSHLGGISASMQNYLTDFQEETRAKVMQYEGSIVEDISSGNVEQAALRTANSIAESSPYLAMAALPGGLGGIMASTASQRQEEQERAGEGLNANTIMNSWADGTAEAVFELPTAALLKLMRGLFTGKMELAKKFSEKFVPQTLKAMGMEGGSEGLTEITQQLTDDLFLGKDPNKTSEDFWNQVKDAILVGAVTGGLIPVATIAAQRTMGPDTKSVVDDLTKQIGKMEIELEKDLAQEIVDEIQGVKDQLQAKKDEILDGEYQKFKALNPAEREKLGDLEKTLDKLSDQYKAIEESPDLDPETKKDLLKKKSDEAKQIYDDKASIVERPEQAPVEKPAAKEGEPQSQQIQIGKGVFTVNKDAEGGIRVFKKDGTEIQEYTERKLKAGGTKRVKNPAYSRIVAKANNTLTDNQINEERKQQWNDVNQNYVPATAEDVVAMAFGNGVKVSRESVQKELGEKASEVMWATGLKKEADLPSVERMAERMAEDNPQLGLQSQDYRNAIIDALGSYNSVEEIRDGLIDKNQQIREPYAGMPEPEQLQAYRDGLTDKELFLLEAVEFDQGIENLSDKEIVDYYETEYSKQIQSLPEAEQAQLYEEGAIEQGEARTVKDEGAKKSDIKAEPKPKVEGKPEIKIVFLNQTELRKAKDYKKALAEQNRIKEEYKQLRQILDCLYE